MSSFYMVLCVFTVPCERPGAGTAVPAPVVKMFIRELTHAGRYNPCPLPTEVSSSHDALHRHIGHGPQ